jgi:hypothetical protein
MSAGPVVDSDDEHDNRDQHDLDDLPELVNIIQPDWLPAQPPPGPLTPLQQPVTPLPIPLPPPLPPQPTQSISIDEVFANFCSVLNLQLIPEDEHNTYAAADAGREAATAAADAAACLARGDFVDFMRPVTPTPEELISLLHRYPEAAAAACAERMRRPHNLVVNSSRATNGSVHWPI